MCPGFNARFIAKSAKNSREIVTKTHVSWRSRE